MKEQQGSKRISSGVIAAISATVIAVSGGLAWYTLNNGTPKLPEEGTKSEQTRTQVGVERNVEIFWLEDTGTNLKLVPQTVKVQASGDSPDDVLKAAFNTMLARPTEGTGSTTIPAETKLLDVKEENDGIHVNLSKEFTSGGGSSSVIGRVGQVVYTATSLDKNAKVYIEVDGEQLTVLGGEGLELEQPLTRESFDKNYPL